MHLSGPITKPLTVANSSSSIGKGYLSTRIYNGGLKVACTSLLIVDTCMKASVSVHTQSVKRTIVIDLVYEKKSDLRCWL